MLRFALPVSLLLAGATAPALPKDVRADLRQRAAAEARDDILIYRTRPGDTLKGLAKRWFNDPEDWRRALALNRLRDGDAALTPGTVLRLRASWVRSTPISAELVAFRGDVVIHRGGERVAATRGMSLGEGDLVETGPNGFATLALPDRSHVSLPSASRVRLARLREVPMSESIDRRFLLEEGRVDVRVTPMANPASRFLITTPVAVAAVRGTEFGVSFTPEERQHTTDVTEGRVGVSRPGASREVLLDPGFGAVATPRGVSRAISLLVAPAVLEPERVQGADSVQFRIDAVPGARRYRFEVATDPAFLDRVAALETVDLEASFEDLPEGRYHVRAFALDASGLRGRPAQHSFVRAAPGAAGAGQRTTSQRDERPAEEGSGDDQLVDISLPGGMLSAVRFMLDTSAPGLGLGGGPLSGFSPTSDLLAELVSDILGNSPPSALAPGSGEDPASGSADGSGAGGSGWSGIGPGGDLGGGGFGGGGLGGGGGGGSGGIGGGGGAGPGSGSGSGPGAGGGGSGSGPGAGSGGSGSAGPETDGPAGPGAQPGTPGAPTQPGLPMLPGDPGSPGLPGDPGVPAFPADPGLPTDPGIPDNPANPGFPADPGLPGNPDAPGTPGVPSGPGGPLPPAIGGTLSPVPEAQTWAMLVAGFGLAGLVIRRRRRKAPA